MEKFTHKQLTEVKNVFDRLKIRLENNTSLEPVDEINVTVYKRWASISQFDFNHQIARVEVPFCYHIKDLQKETPDDSAVFVIGHEYGHAVFDKNLVITGSPLWDYEKKAQAYLRRSKLLKENKDYIALQILEMEIERDPPDEVTQSLFDSQTAAKIIYPYDELFADVIGLSEFKGNEISNILHKRITDSFAKKIPIKGWKDNEVHRYFDPVRSWLWERVLARNLTENERDELSGKVFIVIETELQEIFTNQSLFKKFLEDKRSIEYFNYRLINKFIIAGF